MKALHNATLAILTFAFSMSVNATEVTTQDLADSMQQELAYKLASAECQASVIAAEEIDQGAIIYQTQQVRDKAVVDENTNTDAAWVDCMQEKGIF